MASRIRSLIRKYGGRTVEFRRLPTSARAHLRKRRTEVSDGSAPPHGVTDRYGFVKVPLRELIELVAISQLDYGETDTASAFKEYHEWFIGAEFYDVSLYSELWPITLNIIDERGREPIQDGWHRFHAYVDRYRGNKLIPCLYGKPGELVT